MSLLNFSQTVEIPVTQVNVSEKPPSPAPAQAEPLIAGQYYTACGVVYRALKSKQGYTLMDVNKSWRAGPVWVVNGLFLRGGRLFAGEYVLSGAKSVWQRKPELSALSIGDLQLCGIIKNTIDFREVI